MPKAAEKEATREPRENLRRKIDQFRLATVGFAGHPMAETSAISTSRDVLAMAAVAWCMVAGFQDAESRTHFVSTWMPTLARQAAERGRIALHAAWNLNPVKL